MTSASVMRRELPAISYVSFQSLDPARPLTVCAQFRVPQSAADRIPAVVIAHGSAGIDSRGAFYADALNEMGIASLEIDMWAARGWLAGVRGRPQGVPETLPDAFGALKFLAAQARIDSKHIGILGFSWGGVMAMLCATERYASPVSPGGLKFAAHVANYPVCWVYNRIPGYEFASLTGAPVLIQAGALDTYDEPATCGELVASLPGDAQRFVSYKLYDCATHAWDRLEPPITVTDPFSHLGQGGEVDFVPSPEAALKSRSAAVVHFAQAFKLAGREV
jgi:uncharacterized protein